MTLIAQFVDTHVFGGAESIAVDLAESLNVLGHTSLIFHFGNPEMEAYCSTRKVSHYSLPMLEDYRSWKTLPFFAWKFAHTLKTQGVGLLHSHLFGSVIAGSLATAMARIPHVGSLHDLYTLEESPKRIRALQAATILGTRLVCVAEVLEKYCREHCTFTSSRLRTIHNGVRAGDKPSVGAKISRAELGVSEEDVVFVSVGRLVPLKRHELLIEAFSLLPRQLPARLFILGDGPEKERLQRQIKELNLQDRVSLLGYRSDVSDFLRLGNCFALASSTECLSCSILEAMSEGLPILATRVGGNSALVTEEENGYFIDASASNIAERMLYLVEHRWCLPELGEKSRQKFQNQFTLARMVEEYVKLYRELL